MKELVVTILRSTAATACAIAWLVARRQDETTGWLLRLVLVTSAAYLPFYFDGAEKDGRYFSGTFVRSSFYRFLWTRVAGLPLAEVRCSAKEDGTPSSAFKDPAARFVFGSHPHGAFAFHHMGNMMAPAVCEEGKSFDEISPGFQRRELAASLVFLIPVLRELCLLVGAVDASRPVAEYVSDLGHSIGIVVGGEQEQILSQAGEHTVYVKSRKGFIRLAMRKGWPIVPCYTFGETDLYVQYRVLNGFRRLVVKHLGLAIMLVRGDSMMMPWLPRKGVKLVQCVGRPIPVPLLSTPTREEVNRVHLAYIEGLQQVFDANKASCGYPNAVLNIV